MTSTSQMNPKQPSIIIIWMYQAMMEWISRKSIGFSLISKLMEDFGSKTAGK
jgi:hypothetical protein